LIINQYSFTAAALEGCAAAGGEEIASMHKIKKQDIFFVIILILNDLNKFIYGYI
jgi:hypothetical protein